MAKHTSIKNDKQPEKKDNSQVKIAVITGIVAIITVIVTAIGGPVILKLLDRTPVPAGVTLQPASAPQSTQVASNLQTLIATSVPTIAPSVPTTLPLSATSLPLPVQLPDGPTVAIIVRGQEKIQYTVLSAQREPLPPGRYLLQLRVRAWTDSSNGANFWSDSFRLVVGDQRLAPVNYLNKIVNRNETVDGDVVFEIADSLTDAVLEIQTDSNSETKQLRLTFP